jgi:hypothetical protein
MNTTGIDTKCFEYAFKNHPSAPGMEITGRIVAVVRMTAGYNNPVGTFGECL